MDQKFISSSSVENRIDQKDGERQSLLNFVAEVNSMMSYEVRDSSMELFTRKSYLPQVVGLCLFHCRMTPTFFQMEKLKVQALCNTVKRINDMTVEKLVAHVLELKEEIGKYCLALGWNSWTDVAWMFTMDACFILEFFRGLRGNDMYACSETSGILDDYEKIGWKLNHKRWKLSFDRRKASNIMRDILMLGNQIPLCVLLKILQLEFETPQKSVCVLARLLTLHPQFKLLPFSIELNDSNVTHSLLEAYINEGAYDLLHLVRDTIQHFLTPSNRGFSSTDGAADDIPLSVESLHGIKFKPSTDGEVRFEKSWFTSSILYLPQIHVDQDTEPILRDLMFIERYSLSKKERVISHFMTFMNYLICSRKESVNLLRKEGIIISEKVSDEELAVTFNNLSKGTRVCGQFGAVARQLNGRNYFSTWVRPILSYSDNANCRLDQFSNPC